MGFWSGLGKVLSIAGPIAAAPFTGGASLLGMAGLGGTTAATIGGIAGAAGSALGGLGDSQAKNRGAELASQNELSKQLLLRDKAYQDALVTREQEGRKAEGTNFARLLSAQHALSPASMPSVSPYAASQRQATGAEAQGADLLTQQVLARMAAGNPIPMPEKTDLMINRKLLKPGAAENWTNWLGTGAGLYGKISDIINDPNKKMNV